MVNVEILNECLMIPTVRCILASCYHEDFGVVERRWLGCKSESFSSAVDVLLCLVLLIDNPKTAIFADAQVFGLKLAIQCLFV